MNYNEYTYLIYNTLGPIYVWQEWETKYWD
jgi:hypothetical protein